MSTQLPETVQYGFVQGRIVLSVGDDSDEDQLPNAVPAVGAVSFTALNRITREYDAVPPTTVVSTRVTRALNENGVLVNTDGTPGIWLSVGPHKVAYLLDDVEIPRHDIEVTELHTPDNPLDLTEAIPPGGPVLTPTEYADLMSKFTTLETRVVASVAAPAAQASIDAASASASATSASSSATSALNSANSAYADRIAADASKLAAHGSEESAAISETSAAQAAVASIAARDISVSAKDTSVAAKDDAVIAKTAAETARDISVSAKDTSVAAKDDAVIAKTAAETARDISVSAKDTSVSAKDTSVAAKDDAVIAKTAAEAAATTAHQAFTNHEAAADPHSQYLNNVRGDSRYAAPTGTDHRLQVAGVDVEPEQVGAEPARGSDDNYVTDAEKLALHTHPAVIAQGATQADARTAIGAGDVTTDTVQAITGVKTLTAPVMVAAIPQPVFGPDLAPAMDAWTLAGGASWADPDLTIPAGGTISTTITVESGAIYHIDLTKTATGGSGVQVKLGSVVALMSSHSTTTIPIQSSGLGAQALTIGGGTWTATLQDVVVRKVTPAGPSASPGSSDLRSAGSSNNALGYDAQRSLTTGSSNNALGYAAQRSLTTGSLNNALGYAAQYSLTTGSSNNALGYDAQRSLTTGSSNNALGHSAQYSLTTGSFNNALGHAAQYSLTTGSSNNALGHAAQYSLTTGSFNNALGHSAQRSPAGNSTWATTSGQRQTSVGHESGQGSSVQVNDIVTIGYRAISAGDKGVALGSTASSAHNMSVALGYGTVTTAVDQVAVGPRDVEIQSSDHGIILTSPDASRWRATIDNAGALTWTKL